MAKPAVGQETLEAQMAELTRQIKQKKKYLEDEPRQIQMSHLGWFQLRRVAKKRRIPLSAMLEMQADELGNQFLTEEERREVQEEADAILERRKVPLEELERRLAELEQQQQQES